MSRYYVFNGDADGLCAIQQLRLTEFQPATLVTGVKREINLLKRVSAQAGDDIFVLDISLDVNRLDLLQALARGAAVTYYDHHYAGTVPLHPLFRPYIDDGIDMCTSLIVDRCLDHVYRRWAAVAAFGDNLSEVGFATAALEGITGDNAILLQRLGICLNYNAYGESIHDLLYHPAEIAEQMLGFPDPLDFARRSPIYSNIEQRYETDRRLIKNVTLRELGPGVKSLCLPDTAWAKRAIGLYANELASSLPGDSIAVVLPKSDGGVSISVRIPATHCLSAEEFCRQYKTGGGRRLAAGINHLPAVETDAFLQRFQEHFRR
jgi:hypothetical protein